MTYEVWARRYPEAAQELHKLHVNYAPSADEIYSESAAQQALRVSIAEQGAYSWRNNVGATPASCKTCGVRQRVVRYGMANESTRVNSQVKSSDLILAIPRVITPHMVGSTIAQFGSIEVKKPGWVYSGKGREAAQMSWISLISRIGGFATFSTGRVEI